MGGRYFTTNTLLFALVIPNKIIPVTAEQWQAGVNLDIEIPVNGEALVTVNTAKITENQDNF